jgi:hypothetical protein
MAKQKAQKLQKIQAKKAQMLTFIEVVGSAIQIEESKRELSNSLQAEVNNLYAQNSHDLEIQTKAIELAELHNVPIQKGNGEIDYIDFSQPMQMVNRERDNTIGKAKNEFLYGTMPAAAYEEIRTAAEATHSARKDELDMCIAELELMQK